MHSERLWDSMCMNKALHTRAVLIDWYMHDRHVDVSLDYWYILLFPSPLAILSPTPKRLISPVCDAFLASQPSDTLRATSPSYMLTPR